MKLNKYQEKFIKRVLDHAEKMHNEGNKEIAAMLKIIKENKDINERRKKIKALIDLSVDELKEKI